RGLIANRATTFDDCFRQAGRFFCECDSFRVRLAVDKLEWIYRNDFSIELFTLAVVEKQSQPCAGADAEVVVAVFTNLERVVELTRKQVRFTPVAFNEDILSVYYGFLGRDCVARV